MTETNGLLDQPQQATLTVPCHLYGRGLHLGKLAHLSLLPAPEDTGIVFLLKRGTQQHMVQANWHHIIKKPYCTALEQNGIVIRTPEHLMMALYAHGITNAYIMLDQPEVPIFDGSAKRFVDVIAEAGVTNQHKPYPCLVVTKTFRLERDDGEGYIEMQPYSGFHITMHTRRPSLQHWQGDALPQRARSEIANARTFGSLYGAIAARLFSRFLRDPIALGVRRDNVILLRQNRSYIRGGLRYPNEHVRHKVLDFLGDFYLSNVFFRAKVIADRPTHWFNYHFVKTLFAHPDHWQWQGQLPTASSNTRSASIPN